MIEIHKLAEKFDLIIAGNKMTKITYVGSLKKRGADCLLWSKRTDILSEIKEGTVICSKKDFEAIIPYADVCYLITQRSPRLIFAKVVARYFKTVPNLDFENQVSSHRKNSKIRIGENVFIGSNVSIGNGTLIHHGVTIHGNTRIGKNCLIKVNASLSTEGLGLEMDPETGTYFKFPQIGGVILEDEVEIGPGSTVRRAALDDTIIGRGTKIGALCNIGHNSIIGENCILTCNVVTSGSSRIGNKVFMGVGSIVKQGINVGNNVILGQGSVVVKNVPDGETWVGNPAKKIHS